MTMNRRNVLIGLGATAAGGGAVLGSGAFSQVDANRTVSISTAGDSGGLLSLSLETDSYNGLSDNSGSSSGTNNANTIQINLESINDDAVTTFEDALTIENNGNNPVSLTIDDSALNGVTFTPASSSLAADVSDNTDLTTVKIEVDTTTSVSGGDVKITATDSS